MASARWKLPAWAWSPPTTPSKYGRIVGSWRIPAPTAGKPDARLARNWSGVVWNWAASAGIALASSSAAMAFTVSMSWRLWASAADRKAGRKSLVRLSTPWVLAGRLMTRLPMAMTRPTTRTMPSAMGLRFMKDSLVRGPMLVVRGSGMTSRSDGDGQVLGRQVLGDALFAALTAEAGVLHTAEGSGGVGDEPLVEADHSGLEPLPHPQGAAEVVGVQVRHEAVGRAVGGGYGLVLGPERRDRRNRTEDLLVEDGRRVGHRGQDRGTEEPPGALGGRPADERLRPAVDRVGNERRHLVPGLLLDERPERHAGLGAGADGHPGPPGGPGGGGPPGPPTGRGGPGGGGGGPARRCGASPPSPPRPPR